MIRPLLNLMRSARTVAEALLNWTRGGGKSFFPPRQVIIE
jgi:hypothetical protein